MGAILKKMAISFKENALRPNVFHFFFEKVIISGDLILSTQRIPRGRDPILPTRVHKEFRAAEI